MGYSILVRSYADLQRWLKVIKEHNDYDGDNEDEVGEEMDFHSILRFKSLSTASNPAVPSGLYMLAKSMGDRGQTLDFFHHRLRLEL